MTTAPEIGLYRHYKGRYYQVLEFARHSETDEALVVYRALYGNYGVWIRPFSMFFEKIEKNGRSQQRFALVESQSSLSELIIFDIKPALGDQFESEFSHPRFNQNSNIDRRLEFSCRRLRRCLECPTKFMLIIDWYGHKEHEAAFLAESSLPTWLAEFQHFYQSKPRIERYGFNN